jgi:hypothetical protein
MGGANITCMGKVGNVYVTSVGKPGEEKPLRSLMILERKY